MFVIAYESMPIIEWVYHSQVPKNPNENKFTLTEVDEIIPWIKVRVISLLDATSHPDFALKQTEIIADMQKVWLAPKDIYISHEESATIPDLNQELDLPTFMMATWLHITSNPPIPFEVPYRGPISKKNRYKKWTGAPAHRKKGFLWD